MGIEITQTHAKIGIETTPARLEMESRMARLELRHKQAKVNIHTEQTRVLIDQYECFATAGLKGNYDLSKEAAQLGYRYAMEFIGKTAEDGDRLAAIEKGGNPIVEIAIRDAYPVHEFGLDFIPKARPKISVTGGIRIEPEPYEQGTINGVKGNYVPGYLRIHYTPSKVKIFIRQYNSIKISYKGNRVDSYI